MPKGSRVMHERSALQEEGEMQERCAEVECEVRPKESEC